MCDWIELDAAPRDLAAARVQMHRAAQWLARIARSYLPAADDDSHTALVWSDEPATTRAAPGGGVAPHLRLCEPFPARTPVVAERLIAAYAPRAHALWFGNPERPNNVMPLAERGDDEIAAILLQALGSLGADEGAFSTALPYDVPAPSPAAADADIDRLCTLFANANLVLADIAAREPGASPVRVWPHHFDMATLIALDAPGDKGARSVGVGLSPGDETHAAPYVYVTPWPYPPANALADAPSGLTWRTDGFTALIGDAQALMAGSDGEVRARAALDAAIAACRALLAA